MDCEEAERLAARYADGDLDEVTRRSLDQHLEMCSDCRKAAAEQTEVRSVLASRPALVAPPSFAKAVRRRIDEESGWLGLADWHWLAVRVAPAAVLLLLVAGFTVERNSATQAAVQRPLGTVMETWASGEAGRAPVTAVLWRQGVNDESLLETVLTIPADATIGGQFDDR